MADLKIAPEELEARILEHGQQIFREVANETPSVFNSEFYTGKLLDWGMKDEEFKTRLFRFVDVLPALNDSESVITHAKEYFDPVRDRIPGLMRWGLNINPDSMTSSLAAQMIRRQIRSLALTFILGETPEDSLKALRKIRRNAKAFTVDLVGEAALSENESKEYLEKYLKLLEVLNAQVPKWKESQPLVEDHPGEQTPINISVKLSALYSQIKTVSSEASVEILAERLKQIFRQAVAIDAYVYVDMEDSSLTSITLNTFKAALDDDEFKNFGKAGIVLQTSLRRTKDDLKELIAWARRRSSPIGVRLVKGAYWDTEVVLAKQRDWPIPVWLHKPSSDASFEELTQALLKNCDVIYPAFGSHNIRSLEFAAQVAELSGIKKTAFEFQALYGMAEPIKQAFIKQGYLVRDYAPIGALIPGMGYLVRRLLENTSNEGFLRQNFREHESSETLLQRPQFVFPDSGEEHLVADYRQVFSNAPLIDFSFPENRQLVAQAIAQRKSEVQNRVPIYSPMVSGKEKGNDRFFLSTAPEKTSLSLGKVIIADEAITRAAIKELKTFFPKWRAFEVKERADILFKAADLMLERREQLIASLVWEAGKQRTEADGEVCEAVDFLRYYAHQALKIFAVDVSGTCPGEENRYFLEPRGITAVISPWNFSLAIPCGMICAALVSGNCVAFKPAEQTSVIAHELCQLFYQAGLPKECLSYLPGYGEEIGELLVTHPDISTIAFTGSKEVGLKIVEKAASSSPGAEHVKRVIAEMGGQNAIIVDDGADLDEAVKGVISSAFAYQGQKCSACSRVLVHKNCYERFLKRLRNASLSLIVGPPSEPTTFVGPIIDKAAFDNISQIIEETQLKYPPLAQGQVPASCQQDGHYIGPTIFVDLPSDHYLLRQEVFGPVTSVVRVNDLDEALAIANGLEYALTGGVYSRNPKTIEECKSEFRVGNLYINRSITGAMVQRHPFGGFAMSGVGSKAGGPNYLMQFLIPRASSENSMRRGFVPELS